MRIELHRYDLTDRRTIGKLSINGQFACYTLEDAVRPIKIPRETAIGYGAYDVTVNVSRRFQKPMPLLLNVPNFEGVRIHSGNTEADTEGCILVGLTRGADSIGDSRKAFDLIFPQIEAAVQQGDRVTIEIVRSIPSGDVDRAGSVAHG